MRVLWIEIQRLEVGSTYVDYTSLLLTSKYSIIPSVTKKIYLKGKGKASMAKDINIQDLINKINNLERKETGESFTILRIYQSPFHLKHQNCWNCSNGNQVRKR